MSERLDGFERELVAAARRRSATQRTARQVLRRRGGRSLSSFLLAALLGVGVAGTAAAGTLLALRDDVISAPATRDVPEEQMPAPGSSRLAAVTAPDPDRSAPPWALRVARSRTGLLCSTVGQRRNGRFGLVGLDGRFRRLPARVTDGCGILRRDAASLIGARVFDADEQTEVRTVVNGIGGTTLRSVTVEAGGRRSPVRVGKGGTFVTALRGYPEDLKVVVELRFTGGRRERLPFGTSRFVVADPDGGRAWRVESFASGVKPGEPPNPRTCARFSFARAQRNPPFSPSACGELGTGRVRRGWFAAVRRLTPGTGAADRVAVDDNGNWRDHPPRTAVWGTAGDDVKSVVVAGPGAQRRTLQIAPSRSFLAVYGPMIYPRELKITVTFRDGHSEMSRGDANLVDGPTP
jgi:hypothetical protein